MKEKTQKLYKCNICQIPALSDEELKQHKNIYHNFGEDFFGILGALPSFIFGLVVLFIMGVVAFAIVKWAFQIVF